MIEAPPNSDTGCRQHRDSISFEEILMSCGRLDIGQTNRADRSPRSLLTSEMRRIDATATYDVQHNEIFAATVGVSD